MEDRARHQVPKEVHKAIRHTAEHTSNLKRSLEVTHSGPAEEVNVNGLGIVKILNAHERLDEEGLGVLHVDVHEAHHSDTHVNCTELVKE